MSPPRTFVRIVAVAALVLALFSLAISAAISITRDDRIRSGTIVVVGDPDVTGMQEVIDELQARVDEGDELRSSLRLDAGAIIIAALVFLWIGVGALIVGLLARRD